jgi:TIR domain
MTDRQIFLSYARVDDETPPGAGDLTGWVKYFHDNLRYELNVRISQDLRFWRDVNDIEPDGVFAREIRAALEQAILMVAVLSPKYIQRPWCRRELDDFVAFPPGPDAPPRSEQVFKILKHYIPEHDLPPFLQNRGRGYKFFVIDPATGIEQPYFMAGRLRERYQQAYFDVINELTDLVIRLQVLDSIH